MFSLPSVNYYHSHGNTESLYVPTKADSLNLGYTTRNPQQDILELLHGRRTYFKGSYCNTFILKARGKMNFNKELRYFDCDVNSVCNLLYSKGDALVLGTIAKYPQIHSVEYR